MAARETVSDVFLETLTEVGIRYLFANLGTDYAPLVESIAKYRAEGRPLPEILLCPHENTAITAAHGYALATGQGQGVFVHVGVGTQNLGGALHNALTGRIPLLIFAGRSPQGTRGERLGSRDNWIHFLQDVRDQGGIIRQFSKWEFNLELPEQIAYALQRGVRMMQSEPKGAIYITAAREVLGMEAGEMVSDSPERYATPVLGELADEAATRLAKALHGAARPLIITSYLGRNPDAVAPLVALSEALRIPVAEPAATYLNFPRDHGNHFGFRAGKAVTEADFILLVNTDVPWIPKHGGPPRDTPVAQLDLDPVKPHITMWDFPVTESYCVDAGRALAKVLEAAESLPALSSEREEERGEWIARHQPAPLTHASEDKLTIGTIGSILEETLSKDAVLFDEAITGTDPLRGTFRRTEPGSYFGLPGGSLGWGGGSALGYKLARPDAEVLWVVGDGSFLFSVPSSLFAAAQRYQVPFLTVILNNGGWNAVKVATERVYGLKGNAHDNNEYLHELGQTGALEQVAGAFGCYAAGVDSPREFRTALKEAREAVAEGRCAVINARIVEG